MPSVHRLTGGPENLVAFQMLVCVCVFDVPSLLYYFFDYFVVDLFVVQCFGLLCMWLVSYSVCECVNWPERNDVVGGQRQDTETKGTRTHTVRCTRLSPLTIVTDHRSRSVNSEQMKSKFKLSG